MASTYCRNCGALITWTVYSDGEGQWDHVEQEDMDPRVCCITQQDNKWAEPGCTIQEPHCSLCGAEGVQRPNDGYSTCCNKRITTAEACRYPENHDEPDQLCICMCHAAVSPVPSCDCCDDAYALVVDR